MRKVLVMIAASFVLTGALPASASPLQVAASPNRASVGQRVVHTIGLGGSGRLDVWISAIGFGKPELGTLPSGSWTLECCPTQTAGTYAWHYRSWRSAPSGRYRFGADAVHPGTYRSTAAIPLVSASIRVWIA
jgi:hypothetical protein